MTATKSILTPAGVSARPFLSPKWCLKHFWDHRGTIYRFYVREMQKQYASATLGVGVAVIQSLALLAVYVFVFSYVLQVRWGHAASDVSPVGFGIVLFAGLIVFSLLADSITAATALILSNAKLVTKVVFPVEILPIVVVMRMATVAGINLGVLLLGLLLTTGRIPRTAPLGLVVIAAFTLFSLGVTYFIAAVSPFFRDISHLIGIVLRLLLYGTPIFYALDRVGPELRSWLVLNPLTWAVESARMLLTQSLWPPASYLLGVVVVSFVTLYAGLLFFMKLRNGFRDVL